MSEPFIAQVQAWGCNFAPRSWSFCAGQLIPISQNTALFSLIGTTYGGDGRSTCALPDLQGRVPVHPGRGPGLAPYVLGQKSGAELVALNSLQIPSHDHGNRQLQTGEGTTEADPANAFLTDGTRYVNNTSDGTMNGPTTSSAAGGSQGHNNMMPFLALNYCIAMTGLYPSRS